MRSDTRVLHDVRGVFLLCARDFDDSLLYHFVEGLSEGQLRTAAHRPVCAKERLEIKRCPGSERFDTAQGLGVCGGELVRIAEKAAADVDGDGLFCLLCRCGDGGVLILAQEDLDVFHGLCILHAASPKIVRCFDDVCSCL